MATAISANRAELLAIANSVASEKMIDKAIVIEAIEEAIQRAARARYGAENDIRAKLDATDNVPTGGTTAEFARQIALESENNARIIRAAGIQGN